MNEFRAALQALVDVVSRDAHTCVAYDRAVALLARPEPHESLTQPFCWVIPGDDNADANGMLDASVDLTGEFTRPLYAHRRPEPEPRITREEAMRLLDEFNVASSKAFSNHNHEYFLQRHKQATEACLAAMLK